MAENGKIDIWKIMTAIFIPVLFFLGQNVIANDRARQDEDKQVRKEIDVVCKEQTIINQNIVIALAEIKTDLKYIKAGVKNGRPDN